MDTTKLKIGFSKWSRKIHMYIGLFLLFFITLFGFSGLLLNHHWEFANFWENRKVTKYDQTIQISGEREQTALLHEIVNKLHLNGSIINPRFSNDSILLSFIVAKPGTRYDVQANLNEGKIMITEAKFNSWGTMRNLHAIRNPTPKEQGKRYPSGLASIWSISIDVLSVGLIVICLGGWYLWLQVGRKRFYLGLISLSGGLILCIYFLLF
ncbi:MAG: PepSY-associated TM helix domain-containing protein [Cyclobacteriaceae bacterium]|nr:PepSY-associated TM helix domain-containing protein [Cyclobacteriaceae bacterium]